MNEVLEKPKRNKAKMVLSIAIAALVLSTAMTSAVMVDDDTEDVEGVIGLVAAFAIGFVVGAFVGHSIANPDNGSGSQEEVNAVLRQAESEKVTFAAETTRTFAGTTLPADAALWTKTTQHWTNAAELAVTSLWEYNKAYNPNLALEMSNMRSNLESYAYVWQAAFDNLYTHTIIEHLNKWANYDHLTDMTAKMVWNGGSLSMFDAIMDFCTVIEDTSVGSTVYIDASTIVESGTYQKLTSGTLYKLSSGNVVLRNLDSGEVVTVRDQKSTLADMTYDGTSTSIASGLYRVETAGATLAGPLSRSGDVTEDQLDPSHEASLPRPSNRSIDPSGAVVVSSGSTMVWFSAHDDVTTAHVGSSATQISELFIETGYVDRSGGNSTDRTYLVGQPQSSAGAADLIAQWNGLITKMNYTVERAATAGATLWLLYDYFEESVPLLSPSSIFSSVEGVHMNAVESAALWTQRMQQSAALWAIHGDKVTAELAAQAWNPDSMGLYIVGDIYFNGELYNQGGSVAFTPYNALNAVDFKVGETTVWNNTGYIMIFGQSDDLTGWGGTTNTSEHKNVAMGPGWTIDVKQIRKGGVMVQSASIVPEQIEKSTVDPGPTPDPITPPSIDSNEKLVKILMIAIAVILIFFGAACMYFGMYTLGGILIAIGLIIAGVGWYQPGWIARFI